MRPWSSKKVAGMGGKWLGMEDVCDGDAVMMMG